jgi:nucleotide-binding universal stress UspA family protein
MITSSHAPDAALATAERSLTALEGTLSRMAADSAVAAERLHEAGAATSPEPHMQAANVVAAPAGSVGACDPRDLSRGACRDTDERRRPGRRGGSERSDRYRARDTALGGRANTRFGALHRGRLRRLRRGEARACASCRRRRRAGHRRDRDHRATAVLQQAGGRPLVEPGDDPSRLLADARAIVAERGTVGNVVVVARKGDPAEELLNIARSVGAARIVIGRRGKNSVARMLMGSVATRVLEHAACDVLVVA